ncbi:MAG: ABC transporter permease [Sulfuritalea sp.]|nr:ABC transporter permease [Sulfuritalea sp.]
MLRMLARDLRAGELTVLFVALALAVAALTSVGFLADRVQRAVELEARTLLGGDLLLSADRPWPDAVRDRARQHGLQVAESVKLFSMVSSAAGLRLAEIMAVSAGYPLRGALRVAPRREVGAGGTAGIPAPGTVWPDERLAGALGDAAGARLRVGALDAEVAAVVTLDPDRGINPFAIAPRAIIRLDDLPATGLVQPGSRIVWRLHVAGEDAAVAAFRAWATARLERGQRIEGLENARPDVRIIVDRAQRFLRLAALLTVVLAAVAVGMAARRYMQRHLDACAVMRCLGASERQILLIHGGEFVVLGLVAILVGGACGYLVQYLMQALLAGLMAGSLPAPGVLPWLQGSAVVFVLVLGFVVPPLLRLKSVPTVRVLRREWTDAEPLTMASYFVGMGCLAALMFWVAGEVRLGAVVLGGFIAALAAFALAGRALLGLATGLAAHAPTVGWRIGLASLRRRGGATLVQIVALALGLTTLLLLTLAKNDLLAAWQGKLPPDAPNRFLLNIQPGQEQALAAFFSAAGLAAPRLEPMVRGRLVQVNGRAVAPQDYEDDRARRLVEREFNLSSRDDLPAGNRVVAGRWHADGGALQFSLEQGLAKTLGLGLADELVFEVAGRRFSGTVTSLRQLEWDSMRINFFVITPAGALADQPTSFIAAFHQSAQGQNLTAEVVRQFPNLTVIELDAIMRQVQTMLAQAINAVQVVFLFSLVAGLLVLYAAIEASGGERSHELAVLRALGGRRSQLRQVVLAEFAALGLLAGLLAGLGASAIGAALARWAFQLDYLPSIDYLLIGVVAGLIGVGLAGRIAMRGAFAGRVIERLREA